jgi:hypothetical protein
MTASLNDIPYEIFFHFILPFITVKEIGALSIASPVWRSMCLEQDVWKTLYLRTVPYKITDDSEHSVHPDWRGIAHRVARIYTYPSSYTIINIPCIPKDLRISLKQWSRIRTDGYAGSNLFSDHTGVNNLSYPGGQRQRTLDNINLYLDYVESEWIKFNRDKELSTTNLCQCANHYKFETLEIAGQCRKYKDFKKVTLKKLLTQSKHARQAQTKMVDKKTRDYEKWRSYTEFLEKEVNDAVILEESAITLCKNLERSIN